MNGSIHINVLAQYHCSDERYRDQDTCGVHKSCNILGIIQTLHLDVTKSKCKVEGTDIEEKLIEINQAK